MRGESGRILVVGEMGEWYNGRGKEKGKVVKILFCCMAAGVTMQNFHGLKSCKVLMTNTQFMHRICWDMEKVISL